MKPVCQLLGPRLLFGSSCCTTGFMRYSKRSRQRSFGLEHHSTYRRMIFLSSVLGLNVPCIHICIPPPISLTLVSCSIISMCKRMIPIVYCQLGYHGPGKCCPVFERMGSNEICLSFCIWVSLLMDSHERVVGQFGIHMKSCTWYPVRGTKYFSVSTRY